MAIEKYVANGLGPEEGVWLGSGHYVKFHQCIFSTEDKAMQDAIKASRLYKKGKITLWSEEQEEEISKKTKKAVTKEGAVELGDSLKPTKEDK